MFGVDRAYQGSAHGTLYMDDGATQLYQSGALVSSCLPRAAKPAIPGQYIHRRFSFRERKLTVSSAPNSESHTVVPDPDGKFRTNCKVKLVRHERLLTPDSWSGLWF